MSRSRLASVLVPLALIAAYAGVWRPLRTWSTSQVLAPMLAAAAHPSWHVVPRAAPPAVMLTREADVHTYNAPAGRAFLLPALVLAMLAPLQLLWLRLLWVALALGALGLGLAMLGVRGVLWAWTLLQFLDAYVTVSLSVGLALLWLRAARPATAPTSEKWLTLRP